MSKRKNEIMCYDDFLVDGSKMINIYLDSKYTSVLASKDIIEKLNIAIKNNSKYKWYVRDIYHLILKECDDETKKTMDVLNELMGDKSPEKLIGVYTYIVDNIIPNEKFSDSKTDIYEPASSNVNQLLARLEVSMKNEARCSVAIDGLNTIKNQYSNKENVDLISKSFESAREL